MASSLPTPSTATAEPTILGLVRNFICSLLLISLPANLCTAELVVLGYKHWSAAVPTPLTIRTRLIRGAHALIHPVNDIIDVSGSIDPGLLSQTSRLTIPGCVSSTSNVF